ncbi:MAG: hypothetical protein ACI8QD_002176 [Cyclobacteriaceae bacterium]|jgi:hypothetical protein
MKYIITTVLLILGSTLLSADALPTNLKITVIGTEESVVEGVTVILYETKEDYLNSTNAIATQTTNKKGFVKFKKLKPAIYFVEAKKDSLKNDGLEAATETLTEGRTNTVSITLE